MSAPLDDPTRRGVLLMVLAMFTVPGIAALAKLATEELPPTEIALGRFVFQSLYLAPAAWYLFGRRMLRPARPWVQAARGGLMGFGTLCYFSALTVLPLADTVAIFFAEPFILTALSALVLGETIGWRRALAIVFGFGGAMLVIQPSFVEVGWPAVLPLVAAFLAAGYFALTRLTAKGASIVEIQLHSGLVSAALLALALAVGTAAGADFLTPVWPSWRGLLLVAGVAGFATVGHLLMVRAFAHAPASTLAPLQYLEIIGATVYGLVLFGDFPDSTTWAGVCVIVSSGMYIIWREHRLARRPSAVSGPVPASPQPDGE